MPGGPQGPKLKLVRQKRFQLEQLVSQNEFIESWRGAFVGETQAYFIKRAREGTILSKDALDHVLTRSFKCQRAIRSNRILSAVERTEVGGQIHIVYPFFDPSTWEPLRTDLFWQHFPGILIRLAVIVDLLHSVDVVHGDMRLSNFLLSRNGCGKQVVLSDLDFAAPAGTHLGGVILGTPGHIPPEVKLNDRLLLESDCYSLGMSLKEYMRVGEPRLAASQLEVFERLNPWIDTLTSEVPASRPRSLLNSLHSAGLLDEREWQAGHRELFALAVLNAFRVWRNEGSARPSPSVLLSEERGTFGIPSELRADLDAIFPASSSRAFRITRQFLESVIMKRCGAYWQLSPTTSQLAELYRKIGQVAGFPRARAFSSTAEQMSPERALEVAANFQQSNEPLKAYLALKATDPSVQPTGSSDRHDAYTCITWQKATLALCLGKLGDACEHFEELLRSTSPSTEFGLTVLTELARLYMLSGDLRRAEALIAIGLDASSRDDSAEQNLNFKRLNAWLLGAQGRIDEASHLLSFVKEECERRGLPTVLARTYNDLGTLAWRRGDFRGARTAYLHNVDHEAWEMRPSEAVSAAAGLAMTFFELADYGSAIKYARQALQHVTTPYDRAKESSLVKHLVLSHGRRGEFSRAEYWLQRLLAADSQQPATSRFAHFYFLSGWLHLCQNRLDDAEYAFVRAEELFTPHSADRNIGKLHMCLAEVALHRDAAESFECSAKSAVEQFQKLGDLASLPEVAFLQGLREVYGGAYEVGNISALTGLLEDLSSDSNCYVAALCTLHILVNATDDFEPASLLRREPVQSVVQRAETPLAKALAAFGAEAKGADSRGSLIATWKAAYSECARGHLVLPAMQLCRRIARAYSGAGKPRPASKYLLQGRELARALGNERFVRDFDREIESVRRLIPDQQRAIQLIAGVAHVLEAVDDKSRAFERIVKYAVEETGAERGVLFLHSKESEQLVVKAAVNCEDECLVEIRDFSQSIPKAAFAKCSPLVIEDATKDRRLNRSKSVAYYNVLSVVCVPITLEGTPIGVLYLDHQTIPAVFTEGDLELVRALSGVVASLIRTVSDLGTLKSQSTQLLSDLCAVGVGREFYTENKSLRQLLEKLPNIARTKSSVLLLGESGTGKELLAQAIHSASLRKDEPFIKVNCAAIPASMVESELFGIVNRAATGVGEREGKFSAADGGTLFFDEICDMPLEMQAKVLRAIEKQEFEKVGSNRTIYTDIRFLYASNRDPKDLLAKEKFRLDLYHRINTIIVEIPPLRNRPEDIMPLATHFARTFALPGVNPIQFSARAIGALLRHAWPGNVRELKNTVERLSALSPGMQIEIEHLPRELAAGVHGEHDQKRGQEMEAHQIRDLLVGHAWNQSAVAKILSMPLSTLRYKIQNYKIRRSP
jgi:Nif-specific regulatory protein